MFNTVYTASYTSPVGCLTLAASGVGTQKEALCGLWIENQKYFGGKILDDSQKLTVESAEIFRQTADWLDIYFSGGIPDFMPALSPLGSDFALSVWKIMESIPYGSYTTYGDIAKQIYKIKGKAKHISAQAVGGAVAHNPIMILIPCHRVIGSDGSLTGYAGGLAAKEYLLELENSSALIKTRRKR